MDDTKVRMSPDIRGEKRKECPVAFNPAFDFFVQVPQRLQNCLKSRFKKSMENVWKPDLASSVLRKEKKDYTSLEVNLEKQLQAWKENPTWVDQPPEIKVSVPKGSLCNLNVKVKVGLPPDAIYNIVIDPDNRRVFKNIKEVTSRRLLVDEGFRQVVELEQAAIWRFLWWSGVISVHVLVDQNRQDYSVRFKQGKAGFMKRFEGCWKVEPMFVDEQSCFPHKPKTWADYDSCTGGKGRVGSMVSLEQLVQPALVPPPPISWYLRGITAKTSEMLINDLQAEAARMRGTVESSNISRGINEKSGTMDGYPVCNVDDIKERWRQKRRSKKQRKSCRKSPI
ncbi:uncharacterized protein LOC143854652 [Tasmannia lanceolata]|uniref:uncharacterized protein LOC143854652 n=1 Tax=Tasmannia lanceolata TaxID=3420 RepID=UPI004062844F